MGSTQYTLRLLTEYAYTLDVLPLELSKNLADLRELDAVLSTPIATITNKFNLIADVMEGKAEFPEHDGKDNEATKQRKKGMQKQDRLEYELSKAASEAKSLKLGSDDKIKVASQLGDLLANRQSYLALLLTTAAQTSRDRSFVPSLLHTTTTFPHLPAVTPVVDTSLESTRRKRAASTRGLLSSMAPAVNSNADDRRDREREKERERERIERERGESPTKKRKIQLQEEERTHHKHRHGHHHHSHHSHKDSSARKAAHQAYLETLHWQPLAGGPQRRGRPAPTAGMLDDFLGRQARSGHRPHPDDDDDAVLDEGELEEVDDPDKVYCICGTVSWGEMLGCDDEDCPKQWYHLACLGLTEAPKGSFVCDECRKRREAEEKHSRRDTSRSLTHHTSSASKRSHKKKERLNGN